jgi:hypothetical protein
MKVLQLAQEYSTEHTSGTMTKIVAAVELCSLKEVQDFAPIHTNTHTHTHTHTHTRTRTHAHAHTHTHTHTHTHRCRT